MTAPELEEAARRVTRPLPAGRGWIVRERHEGRWRDWPQIRITDARAWTRRLRAETAVRLAMDARGLVDEAPAKAAGEIAARDHADWRYVARRAIRSLPDPET